jgi:hypothetical protein
MMRQAPASHAGIAGGAPTAAEAQRLAKKYGTTPAEHKAYVDALKKKHDDKEAHEAAVARFRESLRARQAPTETASSDAALRPPW